MKKSYRFLSIAILLLGMAMSVTAQITAYVGLKGTTNDWKEGNGWNGCVFSFDTQDPSKVAEVVFKLDALPGDEAVFIQSGTAADDRYYAMCRSDYDSEISFCTLNFETNTKTILGDGYSDFEDMAYDPTSKVLYGVARDRSSTTKTVLYSVNKLNGELTEVYRIEDIRIVGIASDGNKGLYATGLNNDDLSLYRINLSDKQITKLHDLGKLANALSFSLDFYKEKLYLVAGANFATIDPVAGTMTILDKKLPKNTLAGLCFTKSTADGTANEEEKPDPTAPVMKVKVVEMWGDAMGDEQGITKKSITYYDVDNNPIRKGDYSKMLGSDEWKISRYTTNIYNDKKQLIQTSSEQYGQSDGEDFGFKPARDTVTYEYDDKGRIIKELTISSGVYIAYEYDDNDNLIKRARWYPDRYNTYEGDYYIMESNEYSDFKAPNCPQKIKGDGVYDSYKTITNIVYDDNNNKVSAKTYDLTGEVLTKAEYWTYENGMLTMYEQKKIKKVENEYQEVDYKRTLYSLDNNNPNRIKEESQSYDKVGETYKWIGLTFYTVTETAEYSSLFSTELSVEVVEDRINTVKLMFTMPNVPSSGGFAFDIYRHGIKIARVLPSDEGAYDPDTQKISYIDQDVKNGYYDYFVQTVLISELGDEEQAFNVSNIINQEMYVELPAATNIHYIAHKVSEGLYVVTVGWDAPENVPAELGFQRYNLFLKGFKVAENRLTDGQATTHDVTFGDVSLESSNAKEIYIETVFKYGKVKSEPTIVSVPTGIENRDMGDMIQINGNQIIINNNASVDIIALNGTILESYQNAKVIDMSVWDKGIYLAKVVCDGKTYVIKLVK